MQSYTENKNLPKFSSIIIKDTLHNQVKIMTYLQLVQLHYAHLMAFFRDNLGKLVPEIKLVWIEMRQEMMGLRDVVTSAGP